MNKIKLPSRRINLVLVFLSLYISIFANSERYVGDFSHSEIEQRVSALSSEIDFKLNSDVKKYLDQFVVLYKRSSETLIGRSMYYFPIIENKLREKDIPVEIKNLIVIESSLNPSARSRVGATGLWQFMRATGRMYGLKIDNVVDERKDVEKSTEAALDYLSDLHERFGDWTLALAAYNCGPGNVRKAMRRSGGRDYWSIRAHLPRETRNYIPKFIAVTYLMNYYGDHGITPKYQEDLFTPTRTAVLHEKTSFQKISKLTGLDVKTIQWHNPKYIGNYIPKSEQGRTLILPSSEMYTLLEKMDAFDLLQADPIQDLKRAAALAYELIEHKDVVNSIEELKAIDGILANFETRNAEFAKRPEIKLSTSMHLLNEEVVLTENYNFRLPFSGNSKDRKKFLFRRDKAAVSLE